MIFESFREHQMPHRTLYRPANSEDLPMFMHCAGGSIAVTEDELNDVVWPLLNAHGVYRMEFADRKEG